MADGCWPKTAASTRVGRSSRAWPEQKAHGRQRSEGLDGGWPQMDETRLGRYEAGCSPAQRHQHSNGAALFLDRDGVINVDRGYVHRRDQFEFIAGIFPLARFWTNELRRPIVVVSNQSGIGRGYFDEATFADLTRWMCDRFAAEHCAIARVYHCPFHPVHGVGEYRRDHPWRKPNPGM